MARRNELATGRRVDSIEAGPLRGRAGDAHVDLSRPGVANHPNDLAGGRASHDRVIDDDHALAPKHGLDRAQLEADSEVTDAVLRFDEGPPDVVRPDEPHLERHAALGRVS